MIVARRANQIYLLVFSIPALPASSGMTVHTSNKDNTPHTCSSGLALDCLEVNISKSFDGRVLASSDGALMKNADILMNVFHAIIVMIVPQKKRGY